MGMAQNSVYIAAWSKGAEAPVTFEYNLDNEIRMQLSDEISFLPKPGTFAQLIKKMSRSFVEETWDNNSAPACLNDICEEFEEAEFGYNPFRVFAREIKKLNMADIYKILLLTDNEGDGCRYYRWKWIDFDGKAEKVSSETVEVSTRYSEDAYREEQLKRIISEEFGKTKMAPQNNIINAVQLQNGSFQPICPNCKHKSQNQIMLFGDCAESTLICKNCGNQYNVSISHCSDNSTSHLLDCRDSNERTKKKASSGKLKPPTGKPKHIDFGGGVQFDFPVGFGFSSEKDTSGEERSVITYGEYKNEVGDSEFQFKCSVELITDSENRIEAFKHKKEDLLQYGQLNGKHTITLCGVGVPLSLFGMTMNMQTIIAYIDVADGLSICLTAHDQIKDKENTYLYTGMYEVLKAISIHGEKLVLNGLSASAIEDIAGISFDGTKKASHKGSKEEANTSRSIRKSGHEYTFPTYDVNDARQRILKKNRQKGRKPGQCDLCLTIPNEELARNGTAVKQFWYTCDLYSEDYAAHVSELQKIAADISKLFVDDPIIPRRDLELYAGNIHDIFSYHALRSFVWTSRTWCKKNKKLLSDFTLEDSLALSLFIAERDGLNYNKIDDKSPQIGSGLLASMHEVDIVVQNPKGFLDIPRDIFHSAAPGDANIFRVVEDLWAYRNIMMDARVYLQGKAPETLSEAESVLREIVASWCAYVFACRSPYFYVRPAVAASVMIEEIPAWAAPKVEATLVDGKFETIDNILVACHQTSGTVNIPEGIIDNMTPWNTSFDGMGNGNQIEKVIYPRSYHGRINFGIGVKSVECKGTATDVWAMRAPEGTSCAEYIRIEKSLPNTRISLSNGKHISEIILPEGLETIDLNWLPSETKRISFPESLKKVEQSFSVFGGKLKKVEVPKTCPALNEIRKYLASKNKEYTLSITVSRQEQRMESIRKDLIRASNAERALQIIDDNRECLSGEMIRSVLANRASKLASRLSSVITRWSGISASAESIAEFISGVLNSEYDEQSWQRCWEMGGSLMDSYVVEPIRGKFANEADPIMTFRELPMRLAEYVVEQYREGCIKHEIYAKISKLQALALEPISIQSDGGPTRPVFAEALKSQITSLQIDEQFFERLMNYSADPTVQRFLTTIVKTTSPQNAEDIIFRLTEDRMTQYDQAVSRFRYTSTCRQITEYLKRPILPSDGDLPDKDLYRDSISRDIEVFNIDSSFVEELRRNWENRTIRIFDNVACSISRDNVNAYANTIIDRKMKQYDRVAAAVDALNNSKAELAREKEALENELSHLGIFAGKRKREIRALLEAMPEREAEIIAQGNQAISDADSASL